MEISDQHSFVSVVSFDLAILRLYNNPIIIDFSVLDEWLLAPSTRYSICVRDHAVFGLPIFFNTAELSYVPITV